MIGWAMDQLVLAVDAAADFLNPFGGGFLNDADKRRLGRGLDERLSEGSKLYDNIKNPEITTPTIPELGETGTGDTFQAGTTRDITNNISITITGNEVIDDNSEALETLAEKIAKVFERRNDLQIMIGGENA